MKPCQWEDTSSAGFQPIGGATSNGSALHQRIDPMEQAPAKSARPSWSLRDWVRHGWTLTANLGGRLSDHNSSVLAAAVAFYSFLSIFPAIAAIVSLYGLVANPHDLKNEIDTLRAILPADVVSPLSAWLANLIQKPRGHFGVGLVVSLVVSIWSARYATATLMTALDIAFAVPEQRTLLPTTWSPCS